MNDLPTSFVRTEIFDESGRVDVILKAADYLARTRGLQDVTILGVSKTSLISIPQIYQHFPDRYSILAGVGVRYAEDLARRIAGMRHEARAPDEGRLRSIIEQIQRFVRDEPAHLALTDAWPFDTSRPHDGLLAAISIALEREPSQAHPDENVVFVAEMIISSCRASYSNAHAISESAIDRIVQAASPVLARANLAG
jgi:AcrR family transcriptional regulator